MRPSHTDRQIAGWQLARHLTLGSIVLAGTLVLGLESAQRWNDLSDRAQASRIARVHSYSGIGVEIEQIGHDHYVRRVFAGTPAEGKVFPGAKLVAVDGVAPGCSRGWSSLIRGHIGSQVNLEVAYDTERHSVKLERALVRIRY